jgi:hypothetical protein
MSRIEEAEERGYDRYDDTLGYAGSRRAYSAVGPIPPHLHNALDAAYAAARKAQDEVAARMAAEREKQ